MNKKVVLITGGSSGIGKAIATKLHQQGYEVYGTSRQPERIKEALPYEILTLDVTDKELVKGCVEQVLEQAGQLDVLINNAGFAHIGFAEEITEEEARFQLETNFWGYVRMTQAVLPHIRARQGTIIQISSLAGSIGVPMQGFYSASKHAVDGFAKSLRMELKPFGVKVVLIKPGFINTGLEESFTTSNNELPVYTKMREKISEEIRSSLAAGDPVEKVANRVAKVLAKRNPSIYYAVGTSGRWLPKLYALFPRLFEFGSLKKFGIR